MKFEDFDVLLDKMIAEEKLIGEQKGREYVLQDDDRLDNFKRLAKEIDIPPLKVLYVYWKKHIDAIINFCKRGHEISEEKIEERIKDARVYLSLMRALIEEERSSENKTT